MTFSFSTVAINMDLEQQERINQLYKIRRTIYEMLEERGYLVKDEDIRMTLQEFTHKLTRFADPAF